MVNSNNVSSKHDNYIFIFNAAKTEIFKIGESDVSTIKLRSNLIQQKVQKNISFNSEVIMRASYFPLILIVINCDIFVSVIRDGERCV